MTDRHEIFLWNDNFETGIPAIDEQHKKLVDLINELAMHLAFQANTLTLEKVFTELTDYARYHFSSEEALIRQYMSDDPMLLDHSSSHRSFEEKLIRLKNKTTNQPSEEVFSEILSFLSHWLAVHILESDKHIAKVALAMQDGASLEEAKIVARDEMETWMTVLVDTILAMYDALASRSLQLMREINQRKKAEEKLRLAASVYENTLEAMFIADSKAVIIQVNPAFCQYTGYGHEEVIGKSLRSLHAGLEGSSAAKIWHSVATTGHWSGEVHNRNKDGELTPEWLTLSAITDDQGMVTHYVGLFSNITQLVQRQHKLEHFAHFDILTGLPNRLLLTDRLDQAIAKVRRDGGHCAVCYLDLDNFKRVNDTYGHAAGDTLLQEVSARVKNVLRAQDTLARLGGDEFVLLIEGLAHPDECRPLIERVLKVVEEPVSIGEHQATVSASIGIDFFSSGDMKAHLILNQADQAMYRVKQAGKSNYAFFHPEYPDTSTAQSLHNSMILTPPLITHTCPERDIYNSLLALDEKNILELGCGRAEITRAIATDGYGRRLTALEVDAIQHSRHQAIDDLPNVDFIMAGAEAIPAPDNHFDVVFMFKSLHHVPLNQMSQALLEIRRVLKPGGMAYISEPIFAGDFNDLLKLFHNEEQVRLAAFEAVRGAVDAGTLTLERQTFFNTPMQFENFADFEQKILKVTHTEHRLSDALYAQVKQKFSEHMSPDGARFTMPIRVDLLRKAP
ncbi:bacteriohemerythrin [Mariprofundus erugo]|nr:bacteriohemerythrin [Mariprofundus erugo]